MNEPYYIAFWSDVLDCWVVCHRLAGTPQLAVDVEALFGDETSTRKLAHEMNLEHYRALGQEREYRKLLGHRV